MFVHVRKFLTTPNCTILLRNKIKKNSHFCLQYFTELGTLILDIHISDICTHTQKQKVIITKFKLGNKLSGGRHIASAQQRQQ